MHGLYTQARHAIKYTQLFYISTDKVYHQSVKLTVILCGIVLFLSDFLVAASSCQCDSSNFER